MGLNGCQALNPHDFVHGCHVVAEKVEETFEMQVSILVSVGFLSAFLQ